MSDSGDSSGWDEWGQHVLIELQRLNAGQDTIKNEIHEMKSDLAKVSVIDSKVGEIDRWKNSVKEVASVTQLKELVIKVEDLERFRIKAIAVFTFVQLVFAAVVALKGMI